MFQNGGQRASFKLNLSFLKPAILTIWLAARYNFENLCGWRCAAVGGRVLIHSFSNRDQPECRLFWGEQEWRKLRVICRRVDWYIAAVGIVTANYRNVCDEYWQYKIHISCPLMCKCIHK